MASEAAEGQQTDTSTVDENQPNGQQGETSEARAEDEGSKEAADEQQPKTEDAGVVVQIGDEPLPKEEPAPAWVKDLRKENRRLQRELREARERQTPTSESPPVLGKKPTLADCDYDEAKFEKEHESWLERKRKVDEAAAQKRQQQQSLLQEHQQRLAAYAEKKVALGASDFEDAEVVVSEAFSDIQQSVILQGAEDAAAVIYALGKHPEKAKTLAAIKDPVKFAWAVAKLEGSLKVTTRKPATQAEKKVSGTAPKSGTVDTHLERLREKAERTGDYSEVVAYKKQQRAKERS